MGGKTPSILRGKKSYTLVFVVCFVQLCPRIPIHKSPVWNIRGAAPSRSCLKNRNWIPKNLESTIKLETSETIFSWKFISNLWTIWSLKIKDLFRENLFSGIMLVLGKIPGYTWNQHVVPRKPSANAKETHRLPTIHFQVLVAVSFTEGYHFRKTKCKMFISNQVSLLHQRLGVIYPSHNPDFCWTSRWQRMQPISAPNSEICSYHCSQDLSIIIQLLAENTHSRKMGHSTTIWFFSCLFRFDSEKKNLVESTAWKNVVLFLFQFPFQRCFQVWLYTNPIEAAKKKKKTKKKKNGIPVMISCHGKKRLKVSFVSFVSSHRINQQSILPDPRGNTSSACMGSLVIPSPEGCEGELLKVICLSAFSPKFMWMFACV